MSENTMKEHTPRIFERLQQGFLARQAQIDKARKTLGEKPSITLRVMPVGTRITPFPTFIENEPVSAPQAVDSPSVKGRKSVTRFIPKKIGEQIAAAGTIGALLGGGIQPVAAETIPSQSQESQFKVTQVYTAEPVKVVATEAAQKVEQAVSDYIVDDLRVSNIGKAVGLVTLPDGSKHVVAGTIDAASGLLNLNDKGRVSFYPKAVVISDSDPNLMIAVGEKTYQSSQGMLQISRDGGKTWTIIDSGGGTMFDIQITPDNNHAFIQAANVRDDSRPMAIDFNLTNNTLTRLDITGISGSGAGDVPSNSGVTTQLQAAGSPDEYSGYYIDLINFGYNKLKYTSSGIQAQQLRTDEGFAKNRLINFKDAQGRDVVLLFNWDTNGIAPNPDGNIGTMFYNENNVQKYAIQPKYSAYSPDGFIMPYSAAIDQTNNKIYMGVDFTYYNAAGDQFHKAFVETMPLNAPTDFNQRQVFELPAQGLIKDTYLEDNNGKLFFVVSMDTGIFVQDVTNRTITNDKWMRSVVSPDGKYRIMLPAALKAANAW